MKSSVFEVFWRFLVLGLYAFGGPTAHIGYFRKEFVEKRAWLSDQDYADTVALCQMLPGPASSQTGMSIGYGRAGFLGAIAAFIGFTLPSAVIMVLLALGYEQVSGMPAAMGVLQGVKLFAVAVVADALINMGKSLCPDRPRVTLAIVAAGFMLLLPHVFTQVGIVLGAAVIGYLVYRNQPVQAPTSTQHIGGKTTALVCGVLFLAGLFALPLFVTDGNSVLGIFDSFYRAGALVFGGGHVVLPMLQAEVVHAGGVSPEAFIVGYSAAQAVPGPMFTLAPFLGGTYGGGFNLSYALAALFGIFAPSFLLLAAAWPFWSRLKTMPKLRAAINGINAAVVGLLLAAFYNPVVTFAIKDAQDVALALLAYLLMVTWKLPIALMVPLFAGIGFLLY
ncbi:chromate efflux transporter [Parendozoicomonas haliclonae]|uniref:Chromate transport protein n=1 Tax=Parendozoicomonas haliclonae TaxID=1960125 RepID=A0A1X7AID3_9GAMM|nr:chromate efflux transporter [Parendozoicomonas haliclonae]SMA44949.1 Chromate transport protein [Parendozoicomonas haliclonae]